MKEITTTRSDNLRSRLEEEIIEGRLQPGQRLDESEIAKRFDVSRTPVREALRSLAASGLIEMRPRQGAVVATLTIPALVEMFEVMSELEGLCVRLACRRITPEQRRAIKAAHQGCIESARDEDPERFYAANKVFHETIYAASRNRFLEQTTRNVRNSVAPYRRYITYQPGRMAGSVEEHEAVLNAILSGNVEEGHRLMRAHVSLLGDRFADLISSLPHGFGAGAVHPAAKGVSPTWI
jgi:DNA-binding GntR family transcriptional regulator